MFVHVMPLVGGVRVPTAKLARGERQQLFLCARASVVENNAVVILRVEWRSWTHQRSLSDEASFIGGRGRRWGGRQAFTGVSVPTSERAGRGLTRSGRDSLHNFEIADHHLGRATDDDYHILLDNRLSSSKV